jgi:hypothetical protein
MYSANSRLEPEKFSVLHISSVVPVFLGGEVKCPVARIIA